MAKTLKKRSVNDRLPTRKFVWTKCQHKTHLCFQTIINDPEEGERNVYHWMDEAGAVMSAMRVSRERGVSVKVYDPEGHIICFFGPREYDWRGYVHSMTGDNERRLFAGDIWKQVNDAAAQQRSNKRKVLKKR